MKKMLFILPLIALLFTGCYKDDIDDLKRDVDKLKEELAQYRTLLDAVANRLYISGYEVSGDKYTITLSDGTVLNVGNSPALVTVGANGNWYIDGVDTGIAVSASASSSTADIIAMAAKAVPAITIGSNGNWFIDGADTNIKARVNSNPDVPTIMAIIVMDGTMTFTFTDGKIIQLETLAPKVEITTPPGGFAFDKMKWFSITPIVQYDENAEYAWTIGNDTIAKTKDLVHVMAEPGNYILRFSAKNGVGEGRQDVAVTIKEKTYVNGVSRVFDYLPAPGQFVNTMPDWEDGETAEQVIARAEDNLKDGIMIHLGGFGGYVVMGFDHTIVNRTGNDFKVLGNAFNDWAEPGIIMVSYDANGNGLPDDEWYEIAGSEYNNPTAIKNYEITYYKPDENKVPTPKPGYAYITDTTYIEWTDNQGGSGYISKNSFHRQSYYPQWKGDSYTLKGTLLQSNIYDKSGVGTNYACPAYDYGYADNWSNMDSRSEIEMDWAVDKNGNPVKLKGIDFVKVYCANRAEGGWLGEVSTEISGFDDLNLE